MPNLEVNSQCKPVDSSAYDMAMTAAYIAGPFVLAYLAAPYLAMATRTAFPFAYRVLVGTPSFTGHYTTFIPAREKACSLVYNNAPVIVGTASTAVQALKKAMHASLNFFKSSPASAINEQKPEEATTATAIATN